MRNRIVWVGAEPPPEIARQLSERWLMLDRRDAETAAGALANGRALVISCNSADDTVVSIAKKQLIDEALRHGLMVRVIAPTEQLDLVQAAIKTAFFPAEKLDAVEFLHDLGETCARFEPGPDFSHAVVFENAGSLRTEQLILLRRAFSDCTHVYLKPLEGGRSATVLLAHAQLADSRAGPYPLPFFAKLDRRPKIERELRNYRECTTLFVPFYARPNIDETRCVLGAEYGLIVGNFVEQSEPLSVVVETGRGQPAINSLFEDALRGWRSQAYRAGHALTKRPISASMGGALFHKPANSKLVAYAQEAAQFGPLTPPDVVARTLDALPAIPHSIALSHGDLHGDNVRVRLGGQAILIDFASVGLGPLVADPAQLEVSLILHALAPEQDWQEMAGALYAPEALYTVPAPRAPTSPLNELWDAVRQIRRIGLGDEKAPGEYASAIAVALLRKASHHRDADEQKSRRPYLLWLAAHIADHLKSYPPTKSTDA
ncbi:MULTISPECIES: phosphotransferase [unclassified Mesorhizobium]|uniref:phosphotransferase n=1 Tax=unclassified Mesorhizobium TaxID=325217 RepID=UPI00333CA705